MKCINCGFELPDGAMFCKNCGADQSAAQVSPAPAEAPKKKKSLLPVILALALVAAGLITAIVLIVKNRNPAPEGSAALRNTEAEAGPVTVQPSEEIPDEPDTEPAVQSEAPSVQPSAETPTEEIPDEPDEPIADQTITTALSAVEKAEAEQGLQALYRQVMDRVEAQDYAGFSALCLGSDEKISEAYDGWNTHAEKRKQYEYGDPNYFVLAKKGDTYFGYIYSYTTAGSTIYKQNKVLCFLKTQDGWRIDSEEDLFPFVAALLPAEAFEAYNSGTTLKGFNSADTELRWATDYVENGERNYTVYLLWRNQDGSVSLLVHLNNGWNANAGFSGAFRFGESTEDWKDIKTLYGVSEEYTCVVSAHSSKNVIVTIPADHLTEAGKGDWSEYIYVIDTFGLD